jgi:hypothetical protein
MANDDKTVLILVLTVLFCLYVGLGLGYMSGRSSTIYHAVFCEKNGVPMRVCFIGSDKLLQEY